LARWLLAVASFLVPVALFAGQGDRITVRMSPQPNQTVRQRLTTEVAMTMERDTAPSDATPPQPQHMLMTTTMEVISTVGAADGRGYYDARVVADNVELTMTINGQALPAPPGAAAGAAGHPMIFHYDDRGRMIGVDPESPADTATAPFAQAMTGSLANVAPLTLAVGETVTVPTQLKLPIPGSAADGGMSLNGEMRFTLTSITSDGANRIAHLATVSTVAVSRASADATQPQSVPETRMAGEGSLDVDIDRGIVLRNQQRSTLDNISGLAPGAPPAIANTRVHGTVTISADFVK
jgi:hypothetical protein